MAKSAKRPAAVPKRKPVRPLLLAGGLGLIWFLQFQQGGAEPDGPPWSFALILGMRLVADFVGAWVAIATVQFVFALGRLGLAHLRADPERDIG